MEAADERDMQQTMELVTNSNKSTTLAAGCPRDQTEAVLINGAASKGIDAKAGEEVDGEQKTFEDILRVIGRKGRFHILVLTIMALISLNSSLQNLSTVFTLTTPEHRCRLPELENDTYSVQDDHHADLVQRYIPQADGGGYSKCHIMSYVNDTDGLLPEDKDNPKGNLSVCSAWVYDKKVMKRNLVTKLNLVCENTVVRSHVNMMLFMGKMAAGFLQGFFSDWFGRRPCLIVSALGMLINAVGSAFVYNSVSLLVSRFLAGFFATSSYLSVYVLGMEFLSLRQRSLLSYYAWTISAVFDLYMALAAYLLRDWQLLLLVVAWLAAPPAILSWIMPESLRWLKSKNRVNEAEKELQRVARMNGRTVPHGLMSHMVSQREQKRSVLQLFKNLRLTARWTVVYINWIVICMSTYGLAFNISNMGGNIFINFAISGVLDGAVSFANTFVVNKLSRKFFYFGCIIFGACSCILTVVPMMLNAPNWCVVALSLIGKASLVAAYPLLYTYTAELFPTTHRGVGVGSCSMMSRIGGLISPYIADLGLYTSGKLAAILPQLVFGSSAIAGSLLVLTLPDTKDKELPETVDDILSPSEKHKKPQSTTNGGV